MTSRTIARELQRVLGSGYGRAPAIDSSSEGIAWLRSESETQVQPVLLVNKRPRRTTRTRSSLVALAICVVALLAWVALRETLPETHDLPVTTSLGHSEPPSVATALPPEVTAPEVTAPEVPAPEVTQAPPEAATSRPAHRARARSRHAGQVIRDLDF